MNFDEFLQSKKIESGDFQTAERVLWESWKSEFEKMSPTSFSSRKLYLINPLRRKYPLRTPVSASPAPPPPVAPNAPLPKTPSGESVADASKTKKPVVPRPVIKPKPKS